MSLLISGHKTFAPNIITMNIEGGGTMTPMQTYYERLAQSMMKKMEKRGFDVCYCPDRKAAAQAVLDTIPQGSLVSWGGSATLGECQIPQALDNPNYRVIDRDKAATPEEKKECARQALLADYFLMSSNAVTADGILVNVDGNGNRAAALVYGPDHVILLVGMNKVEPNLEAAIDRVHHKAAPPNAIRLGLNTPCALTGSCADCLSPDCICAHTVITRYNRIPGRIKVILIGESLGF